MIKATISADETNWSYDFDAQPWFEQATESEIEELAESDWMGSYEADNVAYWFELQPGKDGEGVKRILEIAQEGFLVIIDAADAEAWLKGRVRKSQAPTWDPEDIETINRHRRTLGMGPVPQDAGYTAKELRDMAETIRQTGTMVNPDGNRLKRKLMR